MGRSDMAKTVNRPVQVHGEMFHSGITIPAATSTAGTSELEVGGVMGAIEVAVVADTAVLIKANKKVTLTVKAADNEGGTYATVVSAETAFLNGASDVNFAAGDFIGSVAVSSEAPPVWKADVATDDSACTGKISVIPYYLPR